MEEKKSWKTLERINRSKNSKYTCWFNSETCSPLFKANIGCDFGYRNFTCHNYSKSFFHNKNPMDGSVHAAGTQDQVKQWSEAQQFPILSEQDQIYPFLIEYEGSLKLLWREYPNEEIFWATYNGVSWSGKEPVSVEHSVRPYLIQYRDNLYSVYCDSTEVFIQTLDNSIKSPSQSIAGRTAWDFSAVNYRDKLFFVYSVEEDDFGSSQIWLTIYNGEYWTAPQQLTAPPRFAYLVHAVVANDSIYLVYASGPDLEEIQAQGGGWIPSVYFTCFDGETWSQPKKAFDGAPQSLTSYGNELYLVYDAFGTSHHKLRTFYCGEWSNEETLPTEYIRGTEQGGEKVDEIVSYVYDGMIFILWEQFPVTLEITKAGKSSLWFATYPDHTPKFATNSIESISGSATVDHSSTTGVSVSITGCSTQDGITLNIDTVDYGDIQPLGTGVLQDNGVAFYDVKISSTTPLGPNATAKITITNAAFSTTDNYVISFWNGNSWVAVTTSFISPNTLSGTLPASALTGTPIMVGKAMSSLGWNFLSSEVILVITVVIALAAIFAVVAWKVRRGKKKQADALI